MTQERRVQERFFLNLKARVAYGFVGEPAMENPLETVTANISSGGAFLKLGRALPLASKVRVEFLLSIDELKKLKFILSVDTLKQLTGRRIWVKATGVVIRQEKEGVAVIFDHNYQLTPMQSADD